MKVIFESSHQFDFIELIRLSIKTEIIIVGTELRNESSLMSRKAVDEHEGQCMSKDGVLKDTHINAKNT